MFRLVICNNFFKIKKEIINKKQKVKYKNKQVKDVFLLFNVCKGHRKRVAFLRL